MEPATRWTAPALAAAGIALIIFGALMLITATSVFWALAGVALFISGAIAAVGGLVLVEVLARLPRV